MSKKIKSYYSKRREQAKFQLAILEQAKYVSKFKVQIKVRKQELIEFLG